ncbi:hypothetical protein GCM10025867_51370 (plasmid) [Frondihabitans sucicola]|uniref:Phage protein n=1 Tax=Frondihabitans sucicola TaxID=1268041 RepID=A0ABN6Y5I3_9MICO|nr:hypothetical protein [Frondihabitans sucicola]BDZ52329.1 hypothetical protein GCM10025867_45700 [Frondihabitans sucicola]BDZ52896.1 hypothetical protein GCM10025867_51370 [Frondihabitans sucicola]
MTGTKALQDQSPVEIDEQLYELYSKQAPFLNDIASASKALKRIDEVELEIAKGVTRNAWVVRDGNKERYETIVAEAKAGLAALRELETPFHDEFNARGGWTRAYVVSGGHVHKSMGCSTCFPTTRFSWVTDFSGHDEAEIVDAAGERACTVCYPSAPVDVLKKATRIFTEDERAAQADREKRAAEKVERDAKKAAKAIEHPTGEVVRDGYGYPTKTEVTAQTGAVDAYLNSLYRPTQIAGWGDGSTYAGTDEQIKNDEIVRVNTEALAFKRGTDVDTQLDIVREKAIAKFIKEFGTDEALAMKDELKALRAKNKARQA